MHQRNFEVCLHMGDLLFEEHSSTAQSKHWYSSAIDPIHSNPLGLCHSVSACEEPGGLSYHNDIFLVLTLCLNLVNVPNI